MEIFAPKLQQQKTTNAESKASKIQPSKPYLCNAPN